MDQHYRKFNSIWADIIALINYSWFISCKLFSLTRNIWFYFIVCVQLNKIQIWECHDDVTLNIHRNKHGIILQHDILIILNPESDKKLDLKDLQRSYIKLNTYRSDYTMTNLKTVACDWLFLSKVLKLTNEKPASQNWSLKLDLELIDTTVK